MGTTLFRELTRALVLMTIMIPALHGASWLETRFGWTSDMIHVTVSCVIAGLTSLIVGWLIPYRRKAAQEP